MSANTRIMRLPSVFVLFYCTWILTSAPAQTPTPRRDAYESWRMASDAPSATDPAAIQTLPGYEVALLRSARGEEEDSWVSMTFDPAGRVIIGREKRGLLRLTLGDHEVRKVEVIEDTLLECRGLLCAYDSLFVNANNSKGFYRLRDTDGDDRFDETTLLFETGGGVGHGRNHLRLGPDGCIYLVHGDSVELPEASVIDPASPLRNYAVDELDRSALGIAEDKRFKNRHREPFGHILRYDPRADAAAGEKSAAGAKNARPASDKSAARAISAGPASDSTVTLLAGGLRNPLDIDFNREGDMFVYDADMEWDAGLPWYRPTRVLQIVSGGEYGWRRSPGTFPAYYEDSLPPVVDIGLGSPTGVAFGYPSSFPEKHREAFYIADWAYGRILAVHLEPSGASYAGATETFVAGRPLNVTDLAFGPDGALYFVTGGRKTQSGLYRIRYTGPGSEEPAGKRGRREAAALRKTRRQLEALHTPGAPGAIAKAWPCLDHPDRWIRFAARVALENQPPERWQLKALRSGSLNAWLAVARVGHGSRQEPLLDNLNALALEELPEEELLLALRAYQVSFARMGAPGEALGERCAERLALIYPSPSRPANHELCELLHYLGAPGFVDKTLSLLDRAARSEDLIQYLYHLRSVEDGWTLPKRRRFLHALAKAEQVHGGRTYTDATKRIRADFTDTLSPSEKAQLADLMETVAPPAPGIPLPPSGDAMVKEWTVEEILPHLEKRNETRSLSRGREAYAATGCVACHRIGSDPATSVGVLGPDLTGVSGRFSTRDLLVSIVHPSHVIAEKYRLAEAPNVSAMPPGLINVLTLQQILDLLAFIEAGGASGEGLE